MVTVGMVTLAVVGTFAAVMLDLVPGERRTDVRPLSPTVELPPRRVGDRGLYTVSEARLGAGGLDPIAAERPLASFEWLPDRLSRDRDGRLHHVHVLEYAEWADPDDSWTRERARAPTRHWILLDSITGAPVAGESEDAGGLHDSARSPLMPIDGDRLHLEVRRTHFIQSPREIPVTLCGLAKPLVAPGHSMTEPGTSTVAQDCSWGPGSRAVPSALRLVGEGHAAGFRTWVLSSDRGSEPSSVAGEGPYRAFLSPEVPYPIRLELGSTPDGGPSRVVRLARFTRGTEPLEARAVDADPVAPADWGPRHVWGPDDSGIEYPFPLSQAFHEAQRALNPAFREFLDAHPDAIVQRARVHEGFKGPYTQRDWQIDAGDEMHRVRACVVKWLNHVEVPPDVDAPLRGLIRPIDYMAYDERAFCSAPAPTSIRPASAPRSLPTVDSVLRLWRAYASPAYAGREPNFWEFDLACTPSCGASPFRLVGGFSRDTWSGFDAAAEPGASRPFTQEARHSSVQVDAQGRVEYLVEFVAARDYVRADSHLAVLPPDASDERVTTLAAEGRVLRGVPRAGAYAAATGAIALLSAALAHHGSHLKQLVARSFLSGLFSRVDRGEALAHPARAELRAIIEANPGIHFQEIRRRFGRGTGVTLHHLRRLVQVGLVAEVARAGYRCYFAPGQVDRRIMDSAPAVRSRMARLILASVEARGEATQSEIAASAGINRASAVHHLRRLLAAGLLEVRREGRRTALLATDLGRQALGVWSQPNCATEIRQAAHGAPYLLGDEDRGTDPAGARLAA